MALLFVRDSLSNKFDLFLWWWCLGSLDIYYTVISNIVSAVTNTKDRPLFEQKKSNSSKASQKAFENISK